MRTARPRVGEVAGSSEMLRMMIPKGTEPSSTSSPSAGITAADRNVTCGMYADSTATCWGGSGVERNAPDDDTEGDGTKFDVISIGWNHRCRSECDVRHVCGQHGHVLGR